VVIEECLDGPECSILAFVSGGTCLCMAPAQDHKRAHDGDTGPNTGGMGVYSPVPIVSASQQAQMEAIMQQTAVALVADGIDYRGVLYGGFMLTADGPKVLEYNCRFGDPETQVVLPRLQSDLVEVMLATDKGELAGQRLTWSSDFAVSVVLASEGYPGSYKKGWPIRGITAAEEMAGVRVYHAGTKAMDDDTVTTNGGRVLDVTALAPTFEEARNKAYEACEHISFEGMWYRSDIGWRML
jgi:phosphoribosylamine--glycine ligase